MNLLVAGAAGWELKLNWVVAGAPAWGTPNVNWLVVVATGGVIPYVNGFVEGTVVALWLSGISGEHLWQS